MQVKIDTKEKFHAITILEPLLAANMTEDLEKSLLPILEKDVKNVVLILKDISELQDAAAAGLVKIQQLFYDSGASFVICELTQDVEQFLTQRHRRNPPRTLFLLLCIRRSRRRHAPHYQLVERARIGRVHRHFELESV